MQKVAFLVSHGVPWCPPPSSHAHVAHAEIVSLFRKSTEEQFENTELPILLRLQLQQRLRTGLTLSKSTLNCLVIIALDKSILQSNG